MPNTTILLAALPWALLTIAIWASFALVRKYAPKLWTIPALHGVYAWLIADVIPVSMLPKLLPVVDMAWRVWEGLPAVLVGAIYTTVKAGGDVRQAWIGALAGALAPLLHHLLKALPFVPYDGALAAPAAKSKDNASPPPWFPPGGATASVCLALALCFAGATSCTPAQVAAVRTVVDNSAQIAAQVSKYIADGSNALSLIQDAANLFFAAKPSPDVQAAVNDKIQACRLGLSAAAHATEGVQALDTSKADAAFADFRAAYSDLEALAKVSGILSSGKLAREGFPEPLAAKHFALDDDEADFAKKKPTCADAYARELHLGCPPADGPAWPGGACSKLTASQVACVAAAKSCLSVVTCEGK